MSQQQISPEGAVAATIGHMMALRTVTNKDELWRIQEILEIADAQRRAFAELEAERDALAEYVADTYDAQTSCCPACGVKKPWHNGICRLAKFRATGVIRAARKSEEGGS